MSHGGLGLVQGSGVSHSGLRPVHRSGVSHNDGLGLVHSLGVFTVTFVWSTGQECLTIALVCPLVHRSGTGLGLVHSATYTVTLIQSTDQECHQEAFGGGGAADKTTTAIQTCDSV